MWFVIFQLIAGRQVAMIYLCHGLHVAWEQRIPTIAMATLMSRCLSLGWADNEWINTCCFTSDQGRVLIPIDESEGKYGKSVLEVSCEDPKMNQMDMSVVC
jgi:hypothetical protein